MSVRRLVVAGVLMLIIAGAAVWQASVRWRPAPLRPAPRRVESARARKPPPPRHDYVGSETCARCHQEIAATYRRHPMWSSVSPIETEAPYFTEASLQPDGMCSYAVSTRNDKLFHHEILRDSEGDVIYDQAVECRFAIGSGARGWSFLLERDDLMFMSPLTWYSTNGAWDLSPGYLPDSPLRFFRRVTGDCLHCHAGQVAVRPGAINRYRHPPFTEMAIGCERCHGPGKEHVARHESGAGLTGDDPIINPADLPPVERESVCIQCHLQADARIPRYGRTHLDFRPGQSLAEVATVLTRDAGEHAAKAVRHVQQMHASQCFQASKGSLGCTSCHDAHSVPSEEEKVAFYRQKCVACHSQEPHCALPRAERLARSAEDSCIACHMPRLPAADVAHTAQTDHRVTRDPSAAPLTAGEAQMQAELAFFTGMRDSLEPWEADRALGLALASDPAPAVARKTQLQRIESLLTPVLDVAPDDVVVLQALGAVCQEQERWDEARTYYDAALRHDPNDEPSLLGLAGVSYATRDYPAALRWLERLTRINDSHAEIFARKAEIHGHMNQWRDGIEAAQEGLKINPRLASLRAWLVDAYNRVGREEEAQRHYEILKRMRTVWR